MCVKKVFRWVKFLLPLKPVKCQLLNTNQSRNLFLKTKSEFISYIYVNLFIEHSSKNKYFYKWLISRKGNFKLKCLNLLLWVLI